MFRNDPLPSKFSKTILVPFCVESSLSGVKEPVEPTQKMVYRRFLDIPEDWRKKKLRLHFEAVDYSTVVFVNKQEVCRHTGGYDSFFCDINKALNDNDEPIEIIVEVTDPTQTQAIPIGKQWTGLIFDIYVVHLSLIFKVNLEKIITHFSSTLQPLEFGNLSGWNL